MLGVNPKHSFDCGSFSELLMDAFHVSYQHEKRPGPGCSELRCLFQRATSRKPYGLPSHGTGGGTAPHASEKLSGFSALVPGSGSDRGMTYT